jgi:N-sulfoglucosamine sulfohydrolase
VKHNPRFPTRQPFFVLALTLVLAVAAPAVAARAAAQPAARPNILVIVSDDQSAEAVGAYGNRDIQTPSLDALSASGMRFERAYVTSPQCLPSRASFMTGQAPIRIGASRFTAPVPPDVPMFPEALRKAGYFTGLAGRAHHLQGAAHNPEVVDLYRTLGLLTVAQRFDVVQEAGGAGGDQQGENALKQFAAFLDQVPEGKPFFLQLGFTDPHRTFDATRFESRYDPSTLTLRPDMPDTPGVRADLVSYYSEISRLDENVGRVLAALDTRRLAANTIVVFVGDNGGALLRGKGTLYELGVRVPLIVRWPGVTKANAVMRHLVSGEDLAPTLLEAAGLPVPPEMTGRSFLAALRGGAYEPRRYVFTERGAHGDLLPVGSAEFDLSRSIVSATHKLIYNATWQLPYVPVDFMGQPFWTDIKERARWGTLAPTFERLLLAPSRPMFELYDLAADPYEMTNLAGRPDVAELEHRMLLDLTAWMIQQRDVVPLPVFQRRNR